MTLKFLDHLSDKRGTLHRISTNGGESVLKGYREVRTKELGQRVQKLIHRKENQKMADNAKKGNGKGNGKAHRPRKPSITVYQMHRIVDEPTTFEGKSAREISRTLSVSENSVRKALRWMRDEGWYARTMVEKEKVFHQQKTETPVHPA